MFERYSEIARQVIFFARMEAGETGATSIDTEHVLIGILAVDPELQSQLGIELDAKSVRNQCEQLRPPGPAIANTVGLPITNDLREVLEHAISVADVQQCREVRTEHLFDSLFEHGGHVSKMLRDFGLEDTAIKSLLKKVDCCRPQRLTAAARQAMSSVLGKMF